MSCQKDCMLIGIAGGTGSGKSTFTNRIKKQFGDDVTVIYHDNYYRRRDDIPFEERKKINYDHPDALETDMLIRHIKQLKAGKSVVCPVYDFSVHNRSDKTVVIKPSKVILVEGILVLQNPELCDLLDIKIFVEADADERILRRVLRDVEERAQIVKPSATVLLKKSTGEIKSRHFLGRLLIKSRTASRRSLERVLKSKPRGKKNLKTSLTFSFEPLCQGE